MSGGLQFHSKEIEKQVGDRVQTLLKDPYLFAAYQRFGAETLRRSSVFHGLDRFMSELGVRGKCCFEVGTWHGLTAAVLSRYFDRVVTVDIENRLLKHEVLAHLGIMNVECIDIKSNEQKAAIARDLDFDFAYLDGNHANDTESDWEITRKCKRVLMHEAWPWQEKVWRLVHQLPVEQVKFNGLGLALWDSTK